MKNLTIPPAPVGAARPKPQAPTQAATSPLDAAFVARIYRSMLWFGIVCTALAAFALPNTAALGSFVGGIALSALVLRSQEVGARALLQPQEKLLGLDARLMMLLLLPLKFAALAGILIVFNALGWLRPIPLALGFTVGLLVIVAKFVGWMWQRARLSQGKQ